MGISIRIEIAAVLGMLQRASDLDTEVLLDLGAEFLLSRIQQRFRAEVAPNLEPWVPSRAALREGRKTLYRTGRLFHSIAVEGSGSVERDIAPGVPYAIRHQLGLGVLARPFMGTNSEDEQMLVDLIQTRAQQMLAGE